MINRSQCKYFDRRFPPAVRHTNGTFWFSGNHKRSIDSFFFIAPLYLLWNPLWSFKNLCDSIYGMEMKRNEKNFHEKRRHKKCSYLEGDSYFRILCIFLFRNLGCSYSRKSLALRPTPVDTVKYWDWDDIVKTVQAFAAAMLTFVPFRDFYGGSNSSSIRVL